MEEITIDIREGQYCVVVQGKCPRARLHWYADGLHIYVRGAMPMSIYARVCNIACNEAIARHIPAISLKRVVRRNLSEIASEDDGQIPLL